jgi:hypothetical protein
MMLAGDSGVHLQCFHLTADSALEPLPAETPAAAWLHDDVKRWLDIETQEPPVLQELLAPFALLPHILHACISHHSVTQKVLRLVLT